ncbi:MAG: hypothetical protein WCE64_03210 [Bacteroidales bacterium]
MRVKYLGPLIFFSLSFYTITAQSVNTKLDQIELIKSSSGTWQTIVGKDTIEKWDHQQYGNGYIVYAYQVVGKESIPQHVNIFSYDPASGKFKGFVLWQRGGFATWIGSFTDEKLLHIDFVTDLIPEKVWGSFDMIFENSTSRKHLHFINGRKTHEEIFTRVN